MFFLISLSKNVFSVNDFSKSADMVYDTDIKTVVLSLSSLGNF